MLLVKIFTLFIILHVALGWTSPKRCNGAYPLQRSARTIRASVSTNLSQTALNQNGELNEIYKDAKFFSVPIRGSFDGVFAVNMYGPNNCKFHTYDPRRLSSVSCQNGVSCKLVHTVSTTKTYTASEGHNWGVKISSKLSLFDKLFEVGGEVSTGGTYTCSFTEGKTTTDTVECAVGADNGAKTLQLYNIQSDMDCQFSQITLNPDNRNNAYGYIYDQFLTKQEVEQIKRNAVVTSTFHWLPNLDKMSEQLFEKLKNKFPLWNPFTDLIYIDKKYNGMYYFKEVSSEPGPRRVIPFSNENGDSIFQYACRLS